MEDIPTRRGSNDLAEVRVSQLSFDEDTFSGRTTATYRKVEVPSDRGDAGYFDVPPSAFPEDATVSPRPYVGAPFIGAPTVSGEARGVTRWIGPSLAGALLGGLIALGAYGAPRLLARLATPTASAPRVSHDAEAAKNEPAAKSEPAPMNEPGAKSELAAKSEPGAKNEPKSDPSSVPAPPPASDTSAAVASPTTQAPRCSEASALSPELCAYIDGVAAGEPVARPRLASFQRFLLERGTTRVRGRILKALDEGGYAFTLSGSFGYCLHATPSLEIGSLYLGWAERLPAANHCANLRAVKYPAMIEALLAATPDTQQALARELQTELARELPRTTPR